jgi:hypothetical protein
MIKKYDLIKCHTVLKDKKGIYFFEGDHYKITNIRKHPFNSNEIDYLISNGYSSYVFSNCENEPNYYRKWFITSQEERNLKLKKLNKNR